MRKKRIKGRSGGPTLYHPERETENYSGILEPSVAQPPLPLQEFLPLQPLSLDLQPPLPLQEFFPEQACFSTFLSAKEAPAECPSELADDIPEPELQGTETPAFKRVMVPPKRPVKAAVNTRELLETFMCTLLLFFSICRFSNFP